MNSIRPAFFGVWQAIACQGEQGGFEGYRRKSLSIRNLGCRSAYVGAWDKSICVQVHYYDYSLAFWVRIW